jgi:hypothetical protein
MTHLKRISNILEQNYTGFLFAIDDLYVFHFFRILDRSFARLEGEEVQVNVIRSTGVHLKATEHRE